jgi:alpha-beta hydrolase superfamily lysophospholipase
MHESRNPDTVSISPGAASQSRLTGDAFIAEDGAALPLRAWLPKGQAKAVVLALHGFNDYSNAFQAAGAQLAKDGIATYAYDQRGFGAAPNPGRWAGTWRLAQDMAEASRLLKARYPRAKLFILGESMGGALAVTGYAGTAGAERPAADGYILSAPAVWGRASMNVFERTALWMSYHVAPGWTLSGSSLHILASDNIEMLRGLYHDPLVIKETRVDAIHGLVDLMGLALESAPKFDAKALLLYGAHDEVIPPAPMRKFIESLPETDKPNIRIAYYRNGYHMLSRDLEGSLVISDMASWMLHPKSRLPSGADIRPEIAGAP